MALKTAKESTIRKQMGFIKFTNRSYPIYEGLNVLGRDPKATVRVKDLIFSKQHAIISVVNDQHFVSDFGSSNGTQIQDITCVPYMMYEIKDWDTIMVGDIVGIYHTGIDENFNHDENATQFNDTIPATQLLTQPLTHKEEQHKTKLLIKPCETDLDLSKSEVYDDIFANETFRQSFQTTGSKYQIEVDETLPTKTHADNSLDSDDIILSTQDNDRIDKQALEIIQNSEHKSQTVNNVDNNSDSDTDIDDDLLVKNPILKSDIPQTNINKNDDDSATDIDDEEDFVKKIQQQSTQFNTSKNADISDSDTDDDLLVKNPLQKSINEENSDDELDLMGPTEKLITDSQNDDDLFLVPTQLLTNKNPDAPTQKTDIHDVPTQPFEFNNKKDDTKTKNDGSDTQNTNISIHEAPTQPFEFKKNDTNSQKSTQKTDINIYEAPTQLIPNIHDDPTQPLENNNKKDLQEDEAPTQLLEINKKNDLNLQDDDAPTQIVEINKKNDLNPQDDDAPTQLVEINNKDDLDLQEDDDDQTQDLLKTDKLEKNREEYIQKQPNSPNDDVPPTQLLDNNKEVSIDDDYLAPTQLLTAAEVHNKDDDDYLAPTQLLEEKIHEAPTQLLENQKKNSDSPKRKKNDTLPFTKSPGDDFLAPTQLLQDIHEAPTLLENPNDSAFLAPTQPIVNEPKSILNTDSPKTKKTVNFSENVVFDAPTQKIPDIHDQPIIELYKDDSDIYDMATQHIPDDANKDISMTQNSDISLKLVLSDESVVEKPKQIDTQAETQLEVNFDLETQRLYVEDQTRRPDNPLANMFAEEPTQNTEDINLNEDKNAEKQEQIKEIERNKRLEIRLQNIKDIEDASSSTSTESKKKGRPKKSIDKVAENAPKLNITKVKPDEKTTEDLPVEEKRPTRGKRISYRQLNSGETELKSRQKKKKETEENDDDFKQEENIVRSPRKQPKLLKVVLDKIEDKPTVVETPKRSSRRLKTPVEEIDSDDFIPKRTRSEETPINKNEETTRSSRRLTKTSSTETEDDSTTKRSTLVEKKKENLIEERRSSRRQTRTPAKLATEQKRSKRGHKETAKEEILIEDSSDSENFPVKKKVIKLEYTQDPSSNSNSSDIIKEKPKKVLKIDDSSSDENTNNTTVHSNTKRGKYEPLNVTITNSQETPVHKVVFTMLNDNELENYVKKLGGSVTDSAQSCTVLVTNKISRSLKFLVAVASGKPIVNADWIRDSMKRSRFLDPWNYILVDRESEAKFKFSLEKSLKISSEKKLLTDISILIAAKKNFEVLKEIIETSGGKIITRAPGKNNKAYVVSYEEEKAKYSKYLKQKNLTVVSAEAIFSGVLQQELHWEDHLLS